MRKLLAVLVFVFLFGCSEPPSQELVAPVVDELGFSEEQVSQQFDTFQEYFDYYLSSGDELRDSVRVEEDFVLGLPLERQIVDGESVRLDFELLPHEVFIVSDAVGSNAPKGTVREFYMELERPSACASQALFGVVKIEECEVKIVSEFFGPFEGKVGELIDKQLDILKLGSQVAS